MGIEVVRTPCDEAAILTSPLAEPCASELGPWILFATILGSSMAFIDGTVVNVALPVLQTELGATVADVQWIVESYALLLASLMLVGGSAGDRFGRRRVFTIGVAIFALASAWCGVAVSPLELIVARAVQGLGGALLVPLSLAIIGASFAQAERGRAIGTWSAATAMTAAIGPVLGGWLVENLSWRWVFYINLPVAAVVLAVTFWRIPESRDPNAGALDIPGAALAVVGQGAFVFGLIESARLGLASTTVIVSLTIGVLASAGFFLVQARSSSPMMPLTLFRSRQFTGANLLTLLLYAALGGALFFLPFNLLQVQGYSPTETGAAFLPLILVISLLSRWAGSVVPRFGARLPLVVGPIIAALGFVLLARPEIGGSYWTTFFPGVVTLGLGMAVSVAPLTTTVMGSVQERHAGLASGVNNAVSRTASLLAIAVFGIVLVVSFNDALDGSLAEFEVPPAIAAEIDRQRESLAAVELPADVEPRLGAALQRAIGMSYVRGFRAVMHVAAVLALLSALSAYLTIDRKSQHAAA